MQLTPRLTDNPHGWQNNLSIRNVPIVMNNIGHTFWVDSTLGADAGSGTRDHPFLTIDYAIGRCTANNNDIILVASGHVETLEAAGAITCDVAGISIIGIGNGLNRPILTFSTSTAASVVITGGSTTIQNIIGVAGIDGLTNPFHVQAQNCWLDIEWRDASSTVEAARAVLGNATADKFRCILKYIGFTAGNACVNAIRLVGSDNVRIDIDFYGIASTAVVEFLTTACTDVNVHGYAYVSGTTDGSKLVVDTVTGSTWYANIFDGGAGAKFSGGSGSALASDDVAALSALVGTSADSTTTDNLHGKVGTDTEMADRSLYDLINGGGPATAASAADPGNNVSLYGAVRRIFDGLQGSAGISTFPAAASPANGVSVAEVLRGVFDRLIGDGTDASRNVTLGVRVVRNTADVLTGSAVALFNIPSGRVFVTAIIGEVSTIIGTGTTPDAKFQFNPVVGTTTDLCATTQINDDEVGTLYTITGIPTDALIATSGHVGRGMTVAGIFLDEGDIEFICDENVSGSIAFTLYYIPIGDGATVTAV